MVDLILKAIALAMGIGVVVLSVMKTLDVSTGILLLGIGLTCISMTALPKKSDGKNKKID